MKSTIHVRLAPKEGCPEADAPVSEHTQIDLSAAVRRAIGRTRSWLLSEQHPAGYWVGELEGDSILESEYVLLLAYFGRERSETALAASRYLLQQQLATGGWGMYPGGELDVSASVKAYWALKLTGEDPTSEPMQRARSAILEAGGADRVNSFTRFFLALLGQIPYEACPEVPPEVVFFPRWSPINIYRISAWSRTILMPLAIVSAQRPVRQLSEACSIRELFLKRPEEWPPLRSPGRQDSWRARAWEIFFRGADRVLKQYRKLPWQPLRRAAMGRVRQWMLKRFEGSDGLGAIFPPIVWSAIALDSLQLPEDGPAIDACFLELEALALDESATVEPNNGPSPVSRRLQPCKSPVWDTAIALRALTTSGAATDSDELQAAVAWLLQREIRTRGDWSLNARCLPSGWCFEYHNQFYPDLDDTAMVLIGLRDRLDQQVGERGQLPPGLHVYQSDGFASVGEAREDVARADAILAASQRAIDWMLALQNRDGGWGAFDRNNTAEFLCHVPFADHNAMIDPSTADLTARVLEALGRWGLGLEHAAVRRGVAYIRREQEVSGSWFGRWGVNYIYGTWQVLVGLRQVGVPADDPAIRAAAQWLVTHQQSSGGWGESPDTYARPELQGCGPETASQTAWAVLGLLAAGGDHQEAIRRGIQYLLQHQRSDGTWAEPEFTGTGFPQVFYLRYHLYPVYFPLLALGQWAREQPSQALRVVAADGAH